MKQVTASNLAELQNVAHTILSEMPQNFVFAFFGNMGVGKTTLIKALCKELGVNEIVTSPTFALVNKYCYNITKSVYHFDFYRIKKIEEVYDIGYEEYFYSDEYCFIEWPELISELLPHSYVYILIEELENGSRLISYEVK